MLIMSVAYRVQLIVLFSQLVADIVSAKLHAYLDELSVQHDVNFA